MTLLPGITGREVFILTVDNPEGCCDRPIIGVYEHKEEANERINQLLIDVGAPVGQIAPEIKSFFIGGDQ